MRYKTYLRHLLKYVFEEAFGGDSPRFLTEEDLAKEAGIHPNTVYKLRTGRTKLPLHRTIWKLLKATEIDAAMVAEELAEVA